MKKLAYLGFVLAVLGLTIAGCQKMQSPVGPPGPELGGVMILGVEIDYCGEATTVDLIAGQHIPVGAVTVCNDKDNLYVTYSTTDGWCMTETHLHVAEDWREIPQKNGNPIPGKFDHKEDHDPCVTEYTYTIPLVWASGTPLFIAAHAAMQKELIIEGAPYYASTVVDAEQGLTKGGGPVMPERSDPEQALKLEQNRKSKDFFSLGFGGWIIVEFDCPIPNGEGNDVGVWEDTWGTYPAEYADVSASQDGVTWIYLGQADNSNQQNNWTLSQFDLGELQWAKYIKIVDVTDPTLRFPNTADAFDVNAVVALQDCIEIKEETAWGNGFDFPGKNWAMYFEYTVQPCPPIGIEPGDFRTQTQGGWGTGCSGDNPGCYRNANFGTCFDNELIVGCDYTALFTSSQAIENFLPAGGTPLSFNQDHEDPMSTEAGVLAGQVVALTLSVGFDLCDADFGASDINLKDLIVDEPVSPFYNMTVEEVLEEANNFLGDCESTFTASDINDCVSKINENFVDGTVVGDFLRLPPLM